MRKEAGLGKWDFDSIEINVKTQALKDSKLLAKIGDIGFHEVKVLYHHECESEYLVNACSASVHQLQNTLIQGEDRSFQQLALYINLSSHW